MEILPKMKILKLPLNTFKMAYLMIKNFKWLTGLSSPILDIRLIHRIYIYCLLTKLENPVQELYRIN